MKNRRKRAARAREGHGRALPAGSDTAYVSAAEAKNRFAYLLEEAQQGRKLVITKHKAPRAVLLSLESYQALTAAREPALEELAADFEQRLARMQTSQMRAAMQRAFTASPAELGRAAVRAGRRNS